MSQFFGCIALHAQINVADVAAQMTTSLDFFQPDAVGVYQTEEVFICNKFLFNTPESVYTTRICQNKRYVVAASCRLDNRAEIAAKIQLENPLEKSDHDYLLAAYTFYQEKCVEHLLGDFSFVVWDKEKKTLFMAKDHLGIKPLFYYLDENILVFSTYIQGIKAVEGINLFLDKLYIARELKNFSPTFEDTFFEHIKRLKPAHYIQFIPDSHQLYEQKYWELTPVNISAFQTEDEIYTELRRLFTEAVVCRTRTHKNIGCQLSGGLDSSAIAVLLSRNLDKNRLHTYSFVLNDKTRAYSERGIDEQETQNMIIEYADLKRENHHKIEEFHYKDVFEELEISNLIMGGYSSSDAIWQDTLFKRAGEGSQVGFMMSGFPGDECVSNSGSLYFYDYLGNRNWRELFRLIQTEKINGLQKIGSYFKAKYHGTYFVAYRDIQKERNLLHPESEYNKLLNIDTEAFKFYPTFKAYLKKQICRPHTCHRTESEGLYALQYGMETVYPLADIRLIQFVYSIPASMFTPQKLDRTLFRNTCINILPVSVRLQKKYNGAMTLAFAEYWLKKQIESFREKPIQNQIHLFDKEKVELMCNLKDISELNRQIFLHKLEKLITYNKI
jgi:asparagine synthase (glutamine-hydrolysing)